MRFGIDADGTIWYNKYPEIGELKPNAKEIINKLYSEGHDIIINTCRAGIHEANCYYALEKFGIKYHYINSNLPKDIEFFKQDCRKISADLYIDDKQLGGIPNDWNEIYEIIQQHPMYNKDTQLNLEL